MNRFQFVEDHQALYGVKRLCRVLQVSRSGFYRWLKGAVARLARRQADEQLAEQVRRIHGEHDGTYGSPRMTAELRAAIPGHGRGPVFAPAGGLVDRRPHAHRAGRRRVAGRCAHPRRRRCRPAR